VKSRKTWSCHFESVEYGLLYSDKVCRQLAMGLSIHCSGAPYVAIMSSVEINRLKILNVEEMFE